MTESPKKVLIVSTVHQPDDPRIWYRQAFALRDAGYDVAFAARGASRVAGFGIKVHDLGTRRTRLGRMALLRSLTPLLSEWKPEIVHLHDPELLFVIKWIKRHVNALLVYDMHENYRTRRFPVGVLIRARERAVSRELSHIIMAFENREMVRDFAERGFDRVTCIPNYPISPAIPVSARARVGPQPVLLYTGVVARNRGLPVMLDLARYCKENQLDWRIRIVGICYRDRDRKWFLKQIRKGGLDRWIQWKGGKRFVPPQEISAEYRDADFGICFMDANPNYTGTIPTKLFEYMAGGLPIICTDHLLWADFIRKTGSGNPVSSVEDIVRVVQGWINNPEEYHMVSRRGLAESKSRQWPAVQERLLEIYDGLLAPDGRKNS